MTLIVGLQEPSDNITLQIMSRAVTSKNIIFKLIQILRSQLHLVGGSYSAILTSMRMNGYFDRIFAVPMSKGSHSGHQEAVKKDPELGLCSQYVRVHINLCFQVTATFVLETEVIGFQAKFRSRYVTKMTVKNPLRKLSATSGS